MRFRSQDMRLRPLETRDVETVAAWMAEESNYKWLDFGAGHQVLHAATLAMMRQRDLHCLRLYDEQNDPAPLGIIAISNLAREFRSGTLWFILGDRRRQGRGATSAAVHLMLDLGFGELTFRQEGGKLCLETECMSPRFIKAVMVKLVEDAELLHI